MAGVVLLAGGIGVWRLLDRGGSDNEIHVTDPAGASTGPVLEWTEFDPGLDNADALGILEPLGDGRILIQAHRFEGDEAGPGFRLLVTENGFDWSEVPIPTGLWPPHFDLSGDRWLVAGYDISTEPGSSNGDPEGDISRVLAGYRAFYSDDQGANWTESAIDFSSSSIQVPAEYDLLPYFVTAALASGDHMVIALQGDEAEASAASDSGNGVSRGSGKETRERPKARIFASDGGAFEQVAEYDGSIYSGVISGHVSTPAGFTLNLYVEGETEQEPARPYTLTSPNGRIWSQSEGAVPSYVTTRGPNGSLWRMVWLSTGYGLHHFDREGTLKAKVAFDNSLPFRVVAGPSGLAVNAVTLPGTDLFTLPDRRITKEGYELRLNEPEGGFTLWDLPAGAAVSECSREDLWARGLVPAEDDCQFTYPRDDNVEMDAEVLVFEDLQTGTELVSFTRGELSPTFPLWIITGLAVDGAEEEQWLGWSANGIEWSWQTPADAFGLDPYKPDEVGVDLAVGDGFVLARLEQWSDHPLPQDRWFIAQVP